MKLPEIKIMVKEVKEERREMTIEEIALARMIDESTIASALIKRAKEKLPGYIENSWCYDGKGYDHIFATFRTETTREATRFERRAVLVSMLFRECDLTLNNDSKINMTGSEIDTGFTGDYTINLLKNKEIIIELI